MMKAEATINLGELKIGRYGQFWNRISPTRGAKITAAFISSQCLKGAVKLAVNDHGLTVITQGGTKPVPASIYFARCLKKAGVIGLELGPNLQPKQVLIILNALSGEIGKLLSSSPDSSLTKFSAQITDSQKRPVSVIKPGELGHLKKAVIPTDSELDARLKEWQLEFMLQKQEAQEMRSGDGIGCAKLRIEMAPPPTRAAYKESSIASVQQYNAELEMAREQLADPVRIIAFSLYVS